MNHSVFAVIFSSTLSTLSHVLIPALNRVKLTIFLNPVFFFLPFISFEVLAFYVNLSNIQKNVLYISYLHAPLFIFGAHPIGYEFIYIHIYTMRIHQIIPIAATQLQ